MNRPSTTATTREDDVSQQQKSSPVLPLMLLISHAGGHWMVAKPVSDLKAARSSRRSLGRVGELILVAVSWSYGS